MLLDSYKIIYFKFPVENENEISLNMGACGIWERGKLGSEV